MIRGRFSGSNANATNDFEELAPIKAAPTEGGWTELVVERPQPFRFLKYEGTWNTHGAIAEVEFFAGDRKLTGSPFSTVADGTSEAQKAFDGDPNTTYRGKEANGQYVGIDLGEATQVRAPEPSVPGGSYPSPLKIALKTATEGSTIRYTIDGFAPSADAGDLFSGPIAIDKGAVVLARAFHPKLAPSPLVVTAYRIGAAVATKEVRTFHIGNSLTDTVVPWMAPLATAGGHTLKFHRFTIPGAPTDWLWDHPGGGFGDSQYLAAFQARAPIHHIFTQPFAGHNRSIENEAEHSRRFYEACRKHSPEVQAWLYVQWPSKQMDDAWSKGEGEVKNLSGVVPAKTFGEAVRNFGIYAKAVQARINHSYGGKPVRIVPAGQALAALKSKMEAGKVPGLRDFFVECFSDDLHMSAKGAYLVSLVHYAAIFRESPEGKVGPLQSGLTSEQSRIFQRIAWETVKPTL